MTKKTPGLLWLALLFSPAMAFGAIKDFTAAPLVEKGSYTLTETDLKSYYDQNPETHGMIFLQTPLSENILYKINDRYEFQAQNWYRYYQQLKFHQHRWAINIDAFLNEVHADTFNEGKKKYFSRLDFNLDGYFHERPYVYLKEWGNLNHPPLKSVGGQDLSRYSDYYKKIDYGGASLNSSLYFNVAFQEKIDGLSGSELTSHNTFELLADSGSFNEKRRLIFGAQKSVWVSSLVFVNDGPAQKIVDALIKKAKRGMDVRVIDENSLRYVHPKLVALMKQNNVKVTDADDFFKYNVESIYHSKVILVDGAQVILGGQNMIDADLGSHGTDFKNRDVDVKVTGPLATDVAANFMEDWNHFASKSVQPFSPREIQEVNDLKARERRSGYRGRQNYSRWLSDPVSRMKGLGRYVAQKPYRNLSAITDTYLAYLTGVKNYLAMTNPLTEDTYNEANGKKDLKLRYKYQGNFNRLYAGLQDLLNRRPQVHMDYITSGAAFDLNEAVPMTVDRIYVDIQKNDLVMANLNQIWMDKTNLYLAPTPYVNVIKDFGVHPNVDSWIYISFMHSKILYFDRLAASVGSFNFQHNATDHAYESTVIALDQDLNKAIDETLVLDMANSVPFVYKNLTGVRAGKFKKRL